MSKDLDPESFLNLGKRPFTVLIDFFVYAVPLAELVKRDNVLSRFQVLLTVGNIDENFLITCCHCSIVIPYLIVWI